MAKEAIEAIKVSEKKADDIEKKAKNDSLEIIKQAKKEASNVIFSKEKEANTKAGLRINFSKSEAKEYLKNNLKKVDEEVLSIEKYASKKLNEARDLILRELLDM